MEREEITNNVGYWQEKANLEYIRQRQEHGVNDPYMITEIDEAFDAGYDKGYQYALQHPQWKSVEEELPMHDVEENGLITYQEVLVSLYDGCVDTDTYDSQLKAWWRYEGEVEYWMPKPQPPRKEDK